MDYIVHLVYFIFLTLSFRVVFGPFRILNLHHVFFISYSVLIYAAAMYVYNNDVRSDSYLYSVYLCPLIYLFVVYFLCLFFGKSREVNSEELVFKNYNVLYKIIIPSILIVMLYVFDIGIDNIAIFHALNDFGSSSETMQLRQESFVSNIHPMFSAIYGYFRATFLPFFLLICFTQFISGNLSKLAFFIFFIVSVFFTISSSAKAPLAYLLFSIVLCFYFIASKELFQKYKKTVIFFIFLVFLLPALLYPILHGVSSSDAFSYALENLARRVFWVPSYVSATYFELYGETLEHTKFASNSILSSFFVVEHRLPAAEVYAYYFPKNDKGLVNASFFATFYAEWGGVGVLLGTILLALTVFFVEKLLGVFYKRPESICVRVVCSIALIQVMLTSYYSILLGRGFLLLPVLFIFYVFFEQQKNK